ncbi:ABC transporter substrate-binding protein [Eoetvoesiella caeni]|uniref:Substrate-binding family protein n=1 Tax=Eoetvoesiella caeni TaxID=645616 RepID=A0A366GZT3_9BURK|nr:ABC transporter substrate-binding protein [Eoetvoesiella caeni]MCI2811114.1 ABC transporter substrate-binding protein [Eoetvoesiella caeni]NYT57079.1 ABC transporter substrate-binding protein [Eoetvoesiella caeni]RBP35079.1 substrate-binding family protein [Eoetvoesiella caeni]
MRQITGVLRLAIAALTLSISTNSLAADPVRIGLGISQTGEFAATTAGPRAAYELWKDQVNAKGGLDVAGTKRPVEFVVYDDQSDAGKVAAIYEKLITDDKVDLLLSPWGSHSHFAIVGVARQPRH